MRKIISQFRQKNVLVYGYAESGIYACKLLKKHKAKVFVFDDDINSLKEALKDNVVIIKKLTKKKLLEMSCLVVSPAVHYDNEWLVFARNHGKLVISELELGYMFSHNKIVAITGTNGKTTTVNLLTQILKTQRKAMAVGNMGYPITRAVFEKKKGIFVTEVSSFMLENCLWFKPNMACITNITSDHLDRHKNFDDYAKLKLKIFQNFVKKEIAIINHDDISYEKLNNLKSKKITFSMSTKCDSYIENNFIFFKNSPVASIENIKLTGLHNAYNILCAVCFAKLLKIKNKNIQKSLQYFCAPKYRFEKLQSVNGIDFINDSKSTNVDSTLKACNSLSQDTILLIGGYDKHLDYVGLFENMPKNVYQVFCYGDIGFQIKEDAVEANYANATRCNKLKDAFLSACMTAKKGDCILFSPATSSFDEYKNFEQRGEYFENLVSDYAKKK